MKYVSLFFCFVITAVQAQEKPLTKLVPIEYKSPSTIETLANPLTPRWSPPADHHRAAVIIKTPDGSQGSGVLIKHTGKGIIALTNRHVVRIGDEKSNPVHRIVTLVSQNGNRFEMEVLATDANLDIALLKSVRDEITAKVSLPLGNFEVPPGTDVELVGFGGPESKIRHFYGEMLTKQVAINATTISGDSGSPLIYGGAIVGINYGGERAIGKVGEWSLIYPASSFVSGPILCQWVNQRCYQIGQCQPYTITQPQYSQPSAGQLYPPYQQAPDSSVGTAPPPPSLNAPISTSPEANSQPSTEALLDDLVEKIVASPEFQSLKGEDGKDGKDGRDGKDGTNGLNGQDGQDGKDAMIDREAIIAEVTARVLMQIPAQASMPSMDEIVSAVVAQIPSCQCDNNNTYQPNYPNPDSSNVPDDAGNLLDSTPDPTPTKYLESNRVLYFTATSCTSCFETTNLVNSLKRSGYPITIITLTTSMAEANQVPQVFVPATGARAMGPSRVKEFLSSISL